MTVWFAAKPIAQQWRFLAEDSGPPLYYLFARLVYLGGGSVIADRLLSLVFATAALAALFFIRVIPSPFDSLRSLRAGSARNLGGGAAAQIPRFARDDTGLVAAAMLAVFPPHIFFSTEARAYALAALLVGAGCLFLHRWSISGSDKLLALGTLSLVLGAYTHWYGVLLLPLPLLLGLMTRRRALIRKGLAATAGAAFLLIPGFWLASVQPAESITWMKTGSATARLLMVLGSLRQLGFAAQYPAIFIAPPPLILQLLSVAMVIPLLVWGTWKSRDARAFAVATLLPLAGVIVFALAGRTFYFPMRFESVLAIPFVLWLAFSAFTLPTRLMRVWVAIAMALGIAVAGSAIADHAARRPDPYRSVARFVRQHVDPSVEIVVSGYGYLEVISQIDREWRPRVIAFPQAQGRHPGWRPQLTLEQLRLETPSLPNSFVWVGALPTAEAQVIAKRFRVRQLFADGPIVAAQVTRRPGGRTSG